MPVSRSTKPAASELNAAPRRRWPALLAFAVLALLAVAITALPASMLQRFLPPSIRAQEFSGSVWHGSAARISVNSGDVGALEWRLHPASLLLLTPSADLHWVKGAFVADGAVVVDRRGITIHNITGGGPIEDLPTIGMAAGWHGVAAFKFSELAFVFAGSGNSGPVALSSAVGDLRVSDVATPQVANGEPLGGYALHVADGAITPDADATALLTDTDGPLEVHAVIRYSAKDGVGMLSGTLKERGAASPALRSQLDGLAQLHARDAEGRIPVDLEFTL